MCQCFLPRPPDSMDHVSTPLTSYSQQGNATAYAPEQEWKMDSAAFMRISADPPKSAVPWGGNICEYR